METVHENSKASEVAPEDVIGSMPDNVMTNILDRLTIKDAVRTGVLSTNWRFKWTMLTQLIFDEDFFEYLPTKYDGKIISRLLLHLKGPVTKFILYIPDHRILDVEDISHWVLFLSRKGIGELTLTNREGPPLKLPTQIFSCDKLKHLGLSNCCLQITPSFRGFPNLLSLDLSSDTFQNFTYWEFIARCPLLETLKMYDDVASNQVKLVEIAKLENLKMLSLPWWMLDNTMRITSSSIFQLTLLPKLQELNLNFGFCNFLEEASINKKVPAAFLCLKNLTLCQVDISSDIMLSCVMDMIIASPNLENLSIKATYKHHLPLDARCNLELDSRTMGQLQLQSVVFTCFNGSVNDVYLIKSLLASSPLLKKIVVHADLSSLGGESGKFKFAQKLLKLHRASPIAEIDLF